MTDYYRLTRRSLQKRVVLTLLAFRPINSLAVRLLRALPPSRFHKRVPVVGGVGRLETGNGPVVMSGTERCDIAKELFWGRGCFESGADRRAIETAIRLSNLASMFLDVGSYSGVFALAVARANPALVSHAFEIVPENFLLLWKNIIENDLVERVRPHLLGIGAEAGHIQVPGAFGTGVLPSSVALDSETDNGITIPVTTLDSKFADFDGKALMKIDVEGFEWPVLQGGKDFIARTKPDIICEILVNAPHIGAVQENLSGFGYRLFRITGEALLHCADIKPVQQERDWLFTTRTSAELAAAGLTVREG